MSSNPYEPTRTDASRERPGWVSFTLWGLPNRLSALAFVWLSLLLAAASGTIGFWYSTAWMGLLFLVAALWYWLAIRWVDKHGTW